MGFDNIYFIAAARTSDKIILASLNYNGKSVEINAVRQLMGTLTRTEPRQLYSFAMQNNAWFILEGDGIIMVMSTAPTYPQRVAMRALTEALSEFTSAAGSRTKSAKKENALSDTVRGVFFKVCEQWDNLSQVDAIEAVQAKVEAVKLQMQDNLQVALENCVKLEQIEQDAEELHASAGIFKAQANSLKKKMWWKNLKMKLLIACIVLVILGVIIIVILLNTGALNNNDKDD